MKQWEALELVALLEAAYRTELPESSRAVYADFLREHPRRGDRFDAALVLRGVIRTAKFFPAIGELEEALTRAERHARSALPPPAPWSVEDERAAHAARDAALARMRGA